MRRKKIRSSPGGDKKPFHFLYYSYILLPFPFTVFLFCFLDSWASETNFARFVACNKRVRRKKDLERKGWKDDIVFCEVSWQTLASLLGAVVPESDCVPISWIALPRQLNTSFHNLSFPTFALWSAVATNMTLKADIRNDSQAIHFIQYVMEEQHSHCFRE
jgi:hypothetical protein